MSHVDHVEVAPRMWDKTIAATYAPKSKEPPEVAEAIQSAVVKHTPSLFDKLKTYLIPALFVFSIIMVSYVLWKYFTKYRNAKAVSKIPTIEASELSEKKQSINPAQIVASEDLSKYEYDSDDDEAEATDEEMDELLDTIQETEEDADEEEEDEEEDEEEEEDAVSIDRFNLEEAESDAPNISHIQQLIMEQGAEEHMPMLEDNEDDTFAINYIDEESQPKPQPQPKAKKSRKPKKVTL